jgi:hypothetical protein
MNSLALKDDIIKIGQTKYHPDKRAKEISKGTGVPLDFNVIHYRVFDNYTEIERQIHVLFKNYRINSKREFFNVPLSKAIIEIDNLAIKQIEDELQKQKLAFQKLTEAHEEINAILKKQKGKISEIEKINQERIKNLEKYINKFTDEKLLRFWWSNIHNDLKISLLENQKIIFGSHEIYLNQDTFIEMLYEQIIDEDFKENIIDKFEEHEFEIFDQTEKDKIIDFEDDIELLLDYIQEYDDDLYIQLTNNDILSQEIEFEQLQQIISTTSLNLYTNEFSSDDLSPLVYLENIILGIEINQELIKKINKLSTLKRLTINRIFIHEINLLKNIKNISQIKLNLEINSNQKNTKEKVIKDLQDNKTYNVKIEYSQPTLFGDENIYVTMKLNENR